MSQLAKAVVAIIAPVAIVAAIWLWLYRPGPPDQAKMVVAKYLEFRMGAAPAEKGGVPRYVHASRPGNFTVEMSGTSFGSGIYYATTFDFMSPQYVAPSGTITPGQLAYAGVEHGSRRLPLTVIDAWCVQVSDTRPPVPRVVLVGEHQDLYNAEWVVHEPAARTIAELNQWLAGVGCNLVLTP